MWTDTRRIQASREIFCSRCLTPVSRHSGAYFSRAHSVVLISRATHIRIHSIRYGSIWFSSVQFSSINPCYGIHHALRTPQVPQSRPGHSTLQCRHGHPGALRALAGTFRRFMSPGIGIGLGVQFSFVLCLQYRLSDGRSSHFRTRVFFADGDGGDGDGGRALVKRRPLERKCCCRVGVGSDIHYSRPNTDLRIQSSIALFPTKLFLISPQTKGSVGHDRKPFIQKNRWVGSQCQASAPYFIFLSCIKPTHEASPRMKPRHEALALN